MMALLRKLSKAYIFAGRRQKGFNVFLRCKKHSEPNALAKTFILFDFIIKFEKIFDFIKFNFFNIGYHKIIAETLKRF